MKLLSRAIILSLLISPVTLAAQQPLIEPKDPELYQPSPEIIRLAKTYDRMLGYYSKRNFSSTRSVRVLLSNYPQHVEPILYAAFEREPHLYRHIIRAAIHAEPGFTRDIMTMALNMDMADPAEIVKIAVEAEPSYADDIVTTAGRSHPEDLENIVRVAVRVEPQMADSIMRSASDQQPGKLESIVAATLEAVPAFGSYLATSLMDLIGLAEPKSADNLPPNAEQIQQRERAMQVLRGARRAGVGNDQLQVIADNYGIQLSELNPVAPASN